MSTYYKSRITEGKNDFGLAKRNQPASISTFASDGFSRSKSRCVHRTTIITLLFTPSLTCQVFGTGSEWRTGGATRLCYQAPASTTAYNDARRPQSRLTDTPGVRVQPTLGRKAYVWSVLEHHHSPREGRGKQHVRHDERKKKKQTNESNK